MDELESKFWEEEEKVVAIPWVIPTIVAVAGVLCGATVCALIIRHRRRMRRADKERSYPVHSETKRPLLNEVDAHLAVFVNEAAG